MSEDLTIWPSEAPKTLWNYELLRPAVDRPYPLPLMGMKPDWVFDAYYAVGVMIILLFAWRRFGQRTFDPTSDDYLVLKELSPTELRGPGKMMQAYFCYAASLVLIYSAFAFFSTVIFAVLKSTNIAGLQVDIDPSSFSERNWPITLALAFAGITELFKPLDICEAWLRRQAHRWVGIPIRVKVRTEKLLRYLDLLIDPDKPKKARQSTGGKRHDAADHVDFGWLDEPPEWARILINQRSGEKRLKQKFVQLRLMTALIREPGTWPDLALLEKVKPLAKRVYGDAETAMLQLEDVLRQKSEDLNVAPPDAAVSRDAVIATEATPLKARGKKTDENSSKGGKLSDAARKRRQQIAVLENAIEKIEKSRRETAALLAVYAERDEQKQNLRDNLVGQAIRCAFPIARPVDTGFWVLVLLLPIFFIYALATNLHAHGLLANVKLGLFTIMATALYETARNTAIFLIPLVSVLGVRSYFKDSEDWRPVRVSGFDRRVAIQCVMIGVVAGLVSVVGLIVVGLAQIAAISENPERFQSLLFAGNLPAAPYFLSFAFCSIAYVLVTIWAIDSLDAAKTRWKAWLFASFNMISVVVIMAGHILYWSGAHLTLATIGSFSEFYVRFNVTDFVVYALIAFLSAGLFAWPSEQKTITTSQPTAGQGKAGAVRQVAAIILIAGMLFGLAGPTQVHAGELGEKWAKAAKVATVSKITRTAKVVNPASVIIPAPVKVEANPKRVVYLGVRYDAEPFSYRAGTGHESSLTFRGYTTDLCYQLFESSGYEVRLIPVNASQRFDMLRQQRPANGVWASERKIDVLCEATTLRYDQRMDGVDGIFSPLVFVSGVSYLMRSSRLTNAFDAYLGYVGGTTAEYVVSLACRNDMFALYDEAPRGQDDCVVVRARKDSFRDGRVVEDSRCDLSLARPRPTNEQGQYHLCRFASHDDLIDWFCRLSDRDLRAKVAYFGDREIIESKLNSARAKERCLESKVEPPQATYTYEPYALLISKADPDLVQFVQRRVYDFFSHRNKATSLFTTYFPGAQMSPVLAYLFLLNSVDEEKYYQVPYLESAQRQDLEKRLEPSSKP